MSRVAKQTLLKSAFLTLVLTASWLASTSVAFAREREWQPQRTWVFVVGILEWQDSETFPSFPKANRRDAKLVNFFRGAGVPSTQVTYLQDAQATTRRVRERFSQMLSQTRDGDFLFVYFTGHGYKSDDERTTFFATYDAGENAFGWSTRSIVSDINSRFHGSRVLLTADCCFSGELVKDARRLDPRFSYAALTSASSNQSSTENWTFTEMLLAGLRGKPYADVDGDGHVTLSELAENEKRDMAFAEGQQAAFIANGLLNETVIALAPQASNAAIGRRVIVRSEGDWYKGRVIDARGNRLRVHYFGYEDADDEWVLPRQIRGDRNSSTAEWQTSERQFGGVDGWIRTGAGQSSSGTTRNGWLTTPLN
ncbi:MAG TPA: hypothetical protein VJT71_12700 [Pyrinomonadaceae bacterium]|nr:hypothetical protein [Pyrinomonadaceae bacterium]